MARKQSTFEKKANEFARVTFLDKDGRPKSAAYLYGFMLSLLFGVIYVGVYLGAGFLLGKAWPDGSVWAILLQYLATAVLGTGICLLSLLIFKGPRRCFPYYAYVWLFVLFVMSVITSLFMCDWASGEGWIIFWQYCTVVFFPTILAILAGGIPTRILWHRELQRQYEAEEEAKHARPSYYNT
jgi:hypothetical protein